MLPKCMLKMVLVDIPRRTFRLLRLPFLLVFP